MNDSLFPEKEKVWELGSATKKLVQVRKEIEMLETEIRLKKEAEKALSETIIPEIMMEQGVSSIVMEDGSRVTVKPYYSAKIHEGREKEAMDWLTQNGFSGLIKSEVAVIFQREEAEQAKDLFDKIHGMGLDPVLHEGVHPKTLQAFVKEQLEQQNYLPTDLFGVHVGSKTKVEIN